MDNLEEIFDVVDEHDRVIGQASRGKSMLKASCTAPSMSWFLMRRDSFFAETCIDER